jgi:hypothetical protein
MHLHKEKLTNPLHPHGIRSGLLAGTMAMAIGLLGGATAAQAAVNCVVGPGVT